MKTLIMVILFSCWSAQRSEAYLLVEDIPHLTQSIISQIANYALYVQQYYQGLTQILNQATQIENQVIQLTNYGNPNYYVNMLNLGPLLNSVGQLQQGIGNQIAFYREASSGLSALSYTGQGLYSNLIGMKDRFGNPINWETNSFRKFGTVNSMLEDYNTSEKTYNGQMKILQQELATAVQGMNSDRTERGEMRYGHQIVAISAQMNALGHTTNLAGQRLAAQQTANQNDAARVQEATRQQQIQERREDLENQAAGWARLIGVQ